MDTPGSSTGTLLQRRKKTVKVGKEEILLILRSYLAHPTKWGDILEDVKQNLDQLPVPAKQLYQTANSKQLRDRMSTKLGKLIGQQTENIEDLDIRSAIQDIIDMEKRLVRRQHSPPLQQDQHVDIRDQAAAELSDTEEQNNNRGVLHQADLSRGEQQNRKRKRPLTDIIRENQLEYNKFIKIKIPKLLRQLGVSSSESSDSE